MDTIPNLNLNELPSQFYPLIANLNPQCPFPLEDIKGSAFGVDTVDADMVVFEADITDTFIRAQIMPRGRPHWSLVHFGFADDAIASVTFTSAAESPYGVKGRYLETDFSVNFHREGFMRGILKTVPRKALEVEGYRLRWACLRIKDHVPLQRRGMLRVDVLGVRSSDVIALASASCMYACVPAV